MEVTTPLLRQLRPLGVIGSAIALMLATGCSSSPKKEEVEAVPAVPNPFALAGATSPDQVKVNRMRVFGDSYSDPGYTGPRGILNWATELEKYGTVTKTENYAIGGAKASFTQTTSIDRQIATWKKTGSAVTERDLAVTYFGYNDIGRNGKPENEIAASKAGYTEAINQLVQAGAANGTNRIFVTQIHDWSRNPGVNPTRSAGQIVDWNNFVAGLANSNPNIIAVDLYTAFNRVLNEPQKYGFTNVTTEDPSKHRTTALFYDPIHFGSRGEVIIARVFQHYLTRAWNWANALEAGAASAAQLNKDIDQGLLVLAMQERQPGTSAFSLVPLGMDNAKRLDASSPLRLNGSGNQAYAGLAFNFSGQSATGGRAPQFGLALNQKVGQTRLDGMEERTQLGFQAHAATLYWMQPVGSSLLWTNHVSHLSQQFGQYGQDDILQTAIANERKGSGLSFESKLRYTMGSSWATVTPWVSLTQMQQRLNAGTMQSMYTTDVSFSSIKSNELVSGLGVDLQFQPVSLGKGRQLQFGGSLMHRESLNRTPYTVSMREASQPLVTQREFIERKAIKQTYLGLNANVGLTRHLHLNAAYAVDLQQREETQAVQLKAVLSF